MGSCALLSVKKNLLFCTESVVKESHNFELVDLKKTTRKERRKKERYFGLFATFWFGTFVIHFLCYLESCWSWKHV